MVSKPLEIAKRTAIFTAVGQIGSMFAGVMMTAMNQGLHGHSSLQGWQWVFILSKVSEFLLTLNGTDTAQDGAMGIPFGVFGLMFFPNLPESTRVPYLSKEELQLAIDRLPLKKSWAHDISLKSLTKRLLAKPDLYILSAYAMIACALEAIVLQGLFLLWMKANIKHFLSYATTTYPLGIQAVSIVSNIGAGYVIDMMDKRIPMVALAGILQLIVSILLLIRTLPTAGVMFAFYLAGSSYIINPIIYGWASVICQRGGDDASRSVIMYVMSMVQSM